MIGREVSVFAIADGRAMVPIAAACDYKRAGDGDTGPNTGGMGAYSPPAGFPDDALDVVRETIVAPVLRGLLAEDEAYRGVLYCGLMWTAAGPQRRRVQRALRRSGDAGADAARHRRLRALPQERRRRCARDRRGDRSPRRPASGVTLATSRYPYENTALDGLPAELDLPDGRGRVLGDVDATGDRVATPGGRVLTVDRDRADRRRSARRAPTRRSRGSNRNSRPGRRSRTVRHRRACPRGRRHGVPASDDDPRPPHRLGPRPARSHRARHRRAARSPTRSSKSAAAASPRSSARAGFAPGDRLAIFLENEVAFVDAYFGALRAGDRRRADQPALPRPRREDRVGRCRGPRDRLGRRARRRGEEDRSGRPADRRRRDRRGGDVVRGPGRLDRVRRAAGDDRVHPVHLGHDRPREGRDAVAQRAGGVGGADPHRVALARRRRAVHRAPALPRPRTARRDADDARGRRDRRRRAALRRAEDVRDAGAREGDDVLRRPDDVRALPRATREGALPHLRLWVAGSAALSAETWNAFKEKFGQEILERYGATETCMCITNRFRGPYHAGAVGIPYPGIRTRVIDPACADRTSPTARSASC